MFEPTATPRVFAVPPGVPFADAFAKGLAERLHRLHPLKRAQVEVRMNTRRALRSVERFLTTQPVAPGLLPRMRPLDGESEGEISTDPLHRRLILAQLVGGLLEARRDLGPRAGAFDLADSLARLLDEVGEAGIPPERLGEIDVGPHAEHWQLGQAFFHLIASRWPALRAQRNLGVLDPGTALRARIEAQVRQWSDMPPLHPLIIAGSTGSRVPTHRLLRAVAHLPQGAVVLPGLDPDLDEALIEEVRQRPEHPQFTLASFLYGLGMRAAEVEPWLPAQTDTPRRRLLSLALRPAPVTDVWRDAAPALSAEVEAATSGLTLLEAPNSRTEAVTLAWAMRRAVQNHQSVALVTPDRSLARRVTAALDRWDILPDDTAGRPLSLTAGGVFLRRVLDALGGGLSSAGLLALLRHPLCGGVEEDRRAHVLAVDQLYRRFARHPGAVPLAKIRPEEDDPWFDWVVAALGDLYGHPGFSGARVPLGVWLARHISLAEHLSAGVAGQSSRLWEAEAGDQMRALFDRLEAAKDDAAPLTHAEYRVLLNALLSQETVRVAAQRGREDVRILGTLEARTEGADVMILAGLNEGTWPALPQPDAWLNRRMRADLGLSAPERRVGLSAHDFQSAASQPQVILSRAKREDGGPAVSSRWLTRLMNLIDGMGDAGARASDQMTQRGTALLREAVALDAARTDLQPAPRPAPRTPRSAFPRTLSVTQIETLIRDPYALYAYKVLSLRPVPAPGRPFGDRDRGDAFHLLLQALAEWDAEALGPEAWPDVDRLALEIFTGLGAPPALITQWRARLASARGPLMTFLRDRALSRFESKTEVWGSLTLSRAKLSAKADRVDVLPGGAVSLIDYKTSSVPSLPQVRTFQQQMPLTALIAARGGFTDGRKAEVEEALIQSLSAAFKATAIPSEDRDPDTVAVQLEALLSRFDRDDGAWPARLRPEALSFAGDYDHLARRGEWDDRAMWFGYGDRDGAADG